MEKGKDLEFQGLKYKFLEQKVSTLPNGKRVQLTQYKVELEDGSYEYPAFVCEVPGNYDYVDLSSLSKDCLERFANSSFVVLTEEDMP